MKLPSTPEEGIGRKVEGLTSWRRMVAKAIGIL